MNGWTWVRVGAVLGFLAVGIGAFGAHGLKARLDTLGTTATFHTGVEYHFYHALALLFVGLMWGPWPARTSTTVACWAFLIGVVLFSGSIYVLSLTGMRKLGMITPFGGVAFLVGWVALALAVPSGVKWPAADGGGWTSIPVPKEPGAAAPLSPVEPSTHR